MAPAPLQLNVARSSATACPICFSLFSNASPNIDLGVRGVDGNPAASKVKYWPVRMVVSWPPNIDLGGWRGSGGTPERLKLSIDRRERSGQHAKRHDPPSSREAHRLVQMPTTRKDPATEPCVLGER